MNNIVKTIGKFIFLKGVYPCQYKRHCRKPIKQGKAIFLEIRNETVGNSLKYLYRELNKKEGLKINCHFLHEESGKYWRTFINTMKFLKDMATAQYVFLDEANNTFACFDKREETKVVQVWHGCGAFKRFGLSTSELKFGSSKKQQQKYPLYHNLDLVTVSSPEVIWAYREAMGVDEDTIQAIGVSRTDVFYDDEYIAAARQKVLSRIPNADKKKTILYAPTFRGEVTKAKAPDAMDLEYMGRTLGEDHILLIKHHPFVKEVPEIPLSCSNFAYDVTKSFDIEDLLCASDICITDYSSLIFEYSLFERPLIFFAYDLEGYNEWRGFYYDYDELTPGPVVSDTEALVQSINDLEENFDSKEIRAFKDKFMSACDGSATKRILEYVGL
ncbi:MAG: CDP-glycerol glycerophosphotransferase family protein [Bacillota bacterium]|nr:CDP-glycerol glycerophosphotransferase family protein [Bacillota bacterium]